MSIRRNFPPKGTAGLARSRVSGQRRCPCPPPRIAVTTSRIARSLPPAGCAFHPERRPPRAVPDDLRANTAVGLASSSPERHLPSRDEARRLRRTLPDGHDGPLRAFRGRDAGRAPRARDPGADREGPPGDPVAPRGTL